MVISLEWTDSGIIKVLKLKSAANKIFGRIVLVSMNKPVWNRFRSYQARSQCVLLHVSFQGIARVEVSGWRELPIYPNVVFFVFILYVIVKIRKKIETRTAVLKPSSSQ